MSTKQTFFFATPAELQSKTKEFEASHSVIYYRVGLFSSEKPLIFSSLLSSVSLGYVSSGDWNHSQSFLIADKATEIIIRKIPQRKGGDLYAVDQQINLDTVVIKPSGILKDGVLVAGSLGTISGTDYSKGVYKSFAKIIKKNSEKIGEFYVSPEAKNYLLKGWRLVTNEASPTEYDLALV